MLPYDPFKYWPISCDWECHTRRGSLGGIDYAVGVGTPVHAPVSGKLINIPQWNGDGNTAIIHTSNGTIRFLHLSRFSEERDVNPGDIIGYTGGKRGAPGAGNSTGPHLHIDGYIKGQRVPYTAILELSKRKRLPEMEVILNTSNPATAPKYHGDLALFDTHRLIRKMGAGSYDYLVVRYGLQNTYSDAEFLGRLNGFGWTAEEWDKVRSLNRSNAIGERTSDGGFRVYVADDVN